MLLARLTSQKLLSYAQFKEDAVHELKSAFSQKVTQLTLRLFARFRKDLMAHDLENRKRKLQIGQLQHALLMQAVKTKRTF
ncbi:MAG: hypothetical protein K0S07_818 [Chlamydiales bacterium]|jgi:hypothetical protein|nr:hypothetical protein [Chlamydiales bacterium]